jgi:hypothetical protein
VREEGPSRYPYATSMRPYATRYPYATSMRPYATGQEKAAAAWLRERARSFHKELSALTTRKRKKVKQPRHLLRLC